MNTQDILAYIQPFGWFVLGWFGLDLAVLIILMIDDTGLMLTGTIDILKQPRCVELEPEARLGCGIFLVGALLVLLPLFLLIQVLRLCGLTITRARTMFRPK